MIVLHYYASVEMGESAGLSSCFMEFNYQLSADLFTIFQFVYF